jgi:hydrogenase expression/formation protein HypC
MCLAIPAKIESTLGDYVIIHAGFAIRKLDLQEAKESLAILRDLANAYDELQRKYDEERGGAEA